MISGYVEKIVYRNEDNAYSVLEVSSGGEENQVLVGTFPYVEEGDFIKAEGTMKLHPVYGEQMLVSTYEITQPDDVRSIAKYLSSGAVKGVGEALAARIIKKFGEETIRILEEEPERLAEIKGISLRMAMEISAQIEEKKDMRDAMLFLGKYGISMNLALKIYKLYGTSLYSIIQQNPYRLADDITGVGFKIADDIARKAGISVNSEFRIRSGILYLLNEAVGQGHLFLPESVLTERCRMLLEMENDSVHEILQNLQMEKRVIMKPMPAERDDAETDAGGCGCTESAANAGSGGHTESAANTGSGEYAVYPAQAYYTELNTARMLHDINLAVPIEIITGGPGTGKTTNIKRIIEEHEARGLEISLAAPTGRAAKRMEEATGHAASTIHRLLEVSGRPEGEEGGFSGQAHFGRDESNPLEADVVIIDEMSMVDIYLMHALLRAIAPGTRLVLVGDTNQLPSVGPGNVLRDIIASGAFAVKHLKKIYRQAEESDIVANAHRMIDGEPIDLGKKSRDFLFVKRNEPEQIIAAMLTLIMEKLPGYVGVPAREIQVMSPMKKGALGIERLNLILQERLNPGGIRRTEKELCGTTWREGDKVMQIKNNYDLGVYNGDIGEITEINTFAEYVEVRFDEKTVEYGFSDMDQLELAYAITIHKSQGSEYPAVVIPVHQGPRMLMTRNLIYTAVTRASQCVTLVGVPDCFFEMVNNTHEMERYSGLRERICEIMDA